MRTREYKNLKTKLLVNWVFGFLVFFSLVFFGVSHVNAQALPSPSIDACLCVSRADRKASCISATSRAQCEVDNYVKCSIATWEDNSTDCDTAVRSYNSSQPFSPATPGPVLPPSAPKSQVKSTLAQLIIDCGKAGPIENWKECADVTVFISLALQIVQYLFGIIGSVALLFFVYGGFVFILSQGSPDKITHGKDIIISAVLGIVIAFSGYALVRFLGTVVGISKDYVLF